MEARRGKSLRSSFEVGFYMVVYCSKGVYRGFRLALEPRLPNIF